MPHGLRPTMSVPAAHGARRSCRAPGLVARDAALAARFDRRIAGGARLVLAIWAGLALFQSLIAPSPTHAVHLATMILAAVAVQAARDGVNRLIYGGTALTFTVMLYLNATLHLQPVTAGLVDPLRAATIVLVSQAGVTLVALADRLVPATPPLPAADRNLRAQRLQSLATGLFVVVLGGLVLDLAGLMPAILAESLRCLMPLPVALRCLTRRAGPADPWFLALAALAVLVAVRSNARSDLLTVALLAGVLWLIHGRRLVTLPGLATVDRAAGRHRLFGRVARGAAAVRRSRGTAG